jgi:hypothetical protein
MVNKKSIYLDTNYLGCCLNIRAVASDSLKFIRAVLNFLVVIKLIVAVKRGQYYKRMWLFNPTVEYKTYSSDALNKCPVQLLFQR